MSIEYAVLPNNLTDPPSFSPRVVVKDSATLQQLLERVAERTSQSPEAVEAVATAIREEALAVLLNGDSLNWEGFVQLTPTLSGRIETVTGDLPEDSRAGLSVRATRPLLDDFRAAAGFTRVAADNSGPQILEVRALNADLGALRERDVVELAGDRLAFDTEAADEGVFLVESGIGPETRVDVYLATGEKSVRFQVPEGLNPAFPYELRLDARRPGGTILRSFTWGQTVTTAA